MSASIVVSASTIGVGTGAGRRLERGPGAQRFELAGAEPDRLGALPRQVAVQAKLALQLRRGQARDREDEERDQRLEQGGAALREGERVAMVRSPSSCR
jgi:hypothetical protein